MICDGPWGLVCMCTGGRGRQTRPGRRVMQSSPSVRTCPPTCATIDHTWRLTRNAPLTMRWSYGVHTSLSSRGREAASSFSGSWPRGNPFTNSKRLLPKARSSSPQGSRRNRHSTDAPAFPQPNTSLTTASSTQILCFEPNSAPFPDHDHDTEQLRIPHTRAVHYRAPVARGAPPQGPPPMLRTEARSSPDVRLFVQSDQWPCLRLCCCEYLLHPSDRTSTTTATLSLVRPGTLTNSGTAALSQHLSLGPYVTACCSPKNVRIVCAHRTTPLQDAPHS